MTGMAHLHVLANRLWSVRCDSSSYGIVLTQHVHDQQELSNGFNSGIIRCSWQCRFYSNTVKPPLPVELIPSVQDEQQDVADLEKTSRSGRRGCNDPLSMPSSSYVAPYPPTYGTTKRRRK